MSDSEQLCAVCGTRHPNYVDKVVLNLPVCVEKLLEENTRLRAERDQARVEASTPQERPQVAPESPQSDEQTPGQVRVAQPQRDPATEQRLAQIQAREAAAMPGPWWWRINTKTFQLYLFGHKHNIVMDFVRWGMRQAKVRFHQPDGLMHDADTLVTLDHNNEARSIDNPDAEFIAQSRQDIPWLLQQLRQAQGEVERLNTFERGRERAGYKAGRTDERAAHEALARELGEKVSSSRFYWMQTETRNFWEIHLFDKNEEAFYVEYGQTQRECLEQALELLKGEGE